jgi:hypothetical protein
MQKGMHVAAVFIPHAQEKLVPSVLRGTHLLIHDSDSE